jgi:hypothetical protein
MHGNLERVVFLSPQIKLAYSYGWLWKFFRANQLGGGGGRCSDLQLRFLLICFPLVQL